MSLAITCSSDDMDSLRFVFDLSELFVIKVAAALFLKMESRWKEPWKTTLSFTSSGSYEPFFLLV